MYISNVIETDLPQESLLHSRVRPTDFLDCYSVPATLPAREALEVITDFPGWARFLLQIRRLVTTPFGLSNDGPAAQDKVGAFPVETETEREVIAGFNDKHLNFRVSVLSQDDTVYLGTWVRSNNCGGTLYLNAILPFHILIARDALARVGAISQTNMAA